MADVECIQVSARTPMRRLLVSPLSNPIPDNHTDSGVKALLKIDGDICTFLQLGDPTIREKAVLLINHIIIMDKLIGCGKSAWENDDRHLYMHDLETVLLEFGSCSSSLNLKESVYYYTACLFFKVHNYSKALSWFTESKNVYEKNTAGNDLIELERIRRDIFIAFCHEYIGHPENAITFLLDIKSIDIFETALYAHKNDIVSAVVRPESKSDKHFLLKKILSFPEFSHDNVFTNLVNVAKANQFEQEVAELIHVFAHCLSEYKTKADDFAEEYYGKIKFVNLIRLIATKLIDTLGDKYITCKATIRAEGKDRDEALEILPKPDTVTDPKESAEINFYCFYFTELFSDMFESTDDSIISLAGKAFHDYCVDESSGLDDDSKRDALLHYHIFEVKRKLRTQFERILKEKSNCNSLFLDIDFENLDEQWKESFYAVTQRSNDFRGGLSSFANAEIKKEMHLLRLCLNILLEMKANRLPLFFTNDEEETDFEFEVSGNQLFELCKMFSSLFLNGMRPILQSFSISSSKYRTYYINNLRFDILAENYSDFEEWIQKLFDGEQVEYANVEMSEQSSTTKIVFGDKEVVEKQCEAYCRQLINNPQLNIRVFYVGRKIDAFMATPIVAFGDLKTCVLMAFIYATIEYVIDYICKPRPIYILAPLRDTGSYYFQAAYLDRFIPLHHESPDVRKINSEGIGIVPRFNSSKAKEKLECRFANEMVRSSCCCAIIYRDSKLFILRDSGFVEKTNVNHQLVQYCYNEYVTRREKCRKCSAVHTDGQKKCSSNGSLYCDYVYRKSDALAHDNASNNPIAKQLLLELIVIACKEDISDYDNLYVLENDLLRGITQPLSFIVYLFNKDLSILGCPRDWVSVKESLVSVGESDFIEAKNLSTAADFDATIRYRAFIIALYNALIQRQEEALNKWSTYRTEHPGANASFADKKIESLNVIALLIEDLKKGWIDKSPSHNQQSDSLIAAFTECGDYIKINSMLKNTAFEVEV